MDTAMVARRGGPTATSPCNGHSCNGLPCNEGPTLTGRRLRSAAGQPGADPRCQTKETPSDLTKRSPAPTQRAIPGPIFPEARPPVFPKWSPRFGGIRRRGWDRPAGTPYGVTLTGRLRPCAGSAGEGGAQSHPTPGRAGLDPRGGAFRQRRRAPGARGASYAGPLST